jgi:outer membrane receptor protein involved in Fe transport
MNGSSLYYSKNYTYSIEQVKFLGYEGEFNWALSEKFTVFGNYSHLKNSYRLGPNLPPPELLFLAPKNKGSVSFRYSLPAGIRLLTDFQFIGKRGTEGGYSLKRYNLGDIALEKRLKKMTFSVFADNVWNQAYQQVYGFPSPGRTYGVRLQMNTATNPLTH